MKRFTTDLTRASLSAVGLYQAVALLVVLLVGGALNVATVQAQQLPSQNSITADRPGLGDRAATVAGRTFQSEFGYVFNSNGFRSRVGPEINAPAPSVHAFGQVLFRYGLTDAVELRGGAGSYVLNADPVDNGYAGTTVGTKVRLFRTRTSTLTGMATLGLPTGTGAYDTPDDRVRQQVKLAFNGALGTGVALAVNAGSRFYYAPGVQDDRFLEWLFIPTLMFGLTENADAYVGYGGFYREGANTGWVEGGLSFIATPNTQLDLNTGFRVDDNADGYFFGLGLAHRF